MIKKITLLKAIVGSHAHGTNIPESDTDMKGIYIQDPIDVLSFGYKPQLEANKDDSEYEIKRFLELALSSNPTMLELLFTPEDCIVEKHPLFDIILRNKKAFITKGCYNSFMGYAKQQIYKAKGLDKKMNWEKSRTERKTPIDFMFVIDKCKTIPLRKFLTNQGLKEEFCGMIKLNNATQLYCMYYDYSASAIADDEDNPRYLNATCFNYKGICNDNMLLLSEIPKYQMDNGLCNIEYNLNAYQEHCRDYKSYQTWLKERNTQRYVDVKNHKQMIDGKNMLHCYRLLEMAKEIATVGEFNVRRPNAEELIKIRRGEVSLTDLIKKTDALIVEIEEAFKIAPIPDKVDTELVNSILKEIRKESFKLF